MWHYTAALFVICSAVPIMGPPEADAGSVTVSSSGPSRKFEQFLAYVINFAGDICHILPDIVPGKIISL